MRLAIGALTLAAMLAIPASAQDEVILTRQSIMQVNLNVTEMVGLMAEGDIPFNGPVAKAALLQLAANLENFQNLFPADSNHPPSHALPAVFTNRAAFAAMANKMVNDAKAAANDTTNANALKNSRAFKAVTANCNACHMAFRDF